VCLSVCVFSVAEAVHGHAMQCQVWLQQTGVCSWGYVCVRHHAGVAVLVSLQASEVPCSCS